MPLLLLPYPYSSSRNRKIKKEPRRSLPLRSSSSSPVLPRRRSGRRGRRTGRGRRRPRRRAAVVGEEEAAEEEEVELTMKPRRQRNHPRRLSRSHCTSLRIATWSDASERPSSLLPWIKGPMRWCSSRSGSSRRAPHLALFSSNFDASVLLAQTLREKKNCKREKNETAPLPLPLPLARRASRRLGSCFLLHFLQGDRKKLHRPLQAPENHHFGNHRSREGGSEGRRQRENRRRGLGRPRAGALGAPLPRRGAVFFLRLRLLARGEEAEK